jgi:hypothetical protein
MAATCTAFYAEINAGAYSLRARGLLAGANYKLRQAYLAGHADPAAHTLAKSNPDQLRALNDNGLLMSFDAIAGP